MSYSMTPIAPVQELSINSIRLGAVRSFSEQTVGVPIPVHAIGQSLPIGVVRSVAHYEVRVSRLLTDKRVFSETLSPHQLHGFTLLISGGGRQICFAGCEFISLSVRYELGVGTVEEAVIYAAARSELS